MSDQPPRTPDMKDFPDHWGFYLLQAINRLDDKIDQKVDVLEAKIQKLDDTIDLSNHQLNEKIDVLRSDMDRKLTNAQYWYMSTLFVILVGFVTVILTHA